MGGATGGGGGDRTVGGATGGDRTVGGTTGGGGLDCGRCHRGGGDWTAGGATGGGGGRTVGGARWGGIGLWEVPQGGGIGLREVQVKHAWLFLVSSVAVTLLVSSKLHPCLLISEGLAHKL